MPLTGWLVYQERSYAVNRWFANRLIETGRADGLHLELKFIDTLSFGLEDGRPIAYDGDEPIAFPDFIVMRVAYPFASRFFEAAGVRVFNSSAVSRLCNDKCETYLSAFRYAPSVLDVNFYDARFQTHRIVFPQGSVIKSSNGHGGTEVELIEDADQIDPFVSNYDDSHYLIQERFHKPADDIRVYIVGDRIICAVKRIASGFKSNFSLGNEVERYELTAAEEDTVRNLIERLACPFDFIGMDFFMDEHGLVLNEIEDVVGSRMLYETWGYDIAAIYMKHVAETMTGSRTYEH